MSFLSTVSKLRRIGSYECLQGFSLLTDQYIPNFILPIATIKNHVPLRFTHNICWNCGTKRKNFSNLFCEKCNVIQDPCKTKNYFKVFNLDESFDIDKNKLRDKYRKLQSVLHPDKFTNKSVEERTISADFSSLVNNAYNTLQMPIKRAEHLLELKGDKVDEQATLDDPEFLMEMMELNEELENTSDAEKLKTLDMKNKERLKSIVKNIGECFKHSNLKQARYHLIKLKYYSSLGNRINNMLREAGIVD